jgi:hypothetical protein
MLPQKGKCVKRLGLPRRDNYARRQSAAAAVAERLDVRYRLSRASRSLARWI